jgi:hypothetical protein
VYNKLAIRKRLALTQLVKAREFPCVTVHADHRRPDTETEGPVYNRQFSLHSVE